MESSIKAGPLLRFMFVVLLLITVLMVKLQWSAIRPTNRFTSSTTQRCPFRVRRDLVRSKCAEAGQRTSETRTIKFLADWDRKTLGCQWSNTGSLSWLMFMIDSKPRLDPAMPNSEFVAKHAKGNILRHNDFLRRLNLEYLRLTKKTLTEQHSDWTKYVVVRHPMQQAVSRFFQTFKRGNDKAEVYTFLHNLTTTDLVHTNHYLSDQCGSCDLDYDLVIKTETLEEDAAAFEVVTNMTSSQQIPFTHLNRYLGPDLEKHNYKYDPLFVAVDRTNASVMTRLSEVYRRDMERFGYGWDRATKSSFCLLKTENCC